jgi:gas vesicle protein
MNNASLNALEREVEQARAKFANDLAQLRSPTNLARFKDDLWAEARETKDELIGKGKEAAKDAAQRLVNELKDRAAANPAAALAIGAGLAWRLFNRPPIATALVGMGLYGLLRATPSQRSLQPYMGLYDEDPRPADRDDEVGLAEQAAKLGAAAQQKMQEWSTEARDTARQAATQLADKAASAGERAAAGLHDARDAVRDTVTDIADKTSSVGTRASEKLQDAIPSRDERDTYLLGAAALAVAAAVGIAYQRRAHDHSSSRDT